MIGDHAQLDEIFNNDNNGFPFGMHGMNMHGMNMHEMHGMNMHFGSGDSNFENIFHNFF